MTIRVYATIFYVLLFYEEKSYGKICLIHRKGFLLVSNGSGSNIKNLTLILRIEVRVLILLYVPDRHQKKSFLHITNSGLHVFMTSRKITLFRLTTALLLLTCSSLPLYLLYIALHKAQS